MTLTPEETGTRITRIRSWVGRGSVCAALFFILCAFHFLANLAWLAADNHTIRTDEETHMYMARNYYQALFAPGAGNFADRLIASGKVPFSYPAHPPLLHWMGALAIRLTGYSTDHIAATGSVFFLIALLGLWRIARRFLNPAEALFAVFVVSFTPLMYTGSRYFMTDYLSMAVAVWAVYALLRSQWFFDTPWVFTFAVLNGLGVLTRTPAFLCWLAPSALVFGVGLWRALQDRHPAALSRLAFNAVLTVVVSVGIFAPWYYRYLESYYQYWGHQHQQVLSQVPAPEPVKEPPPVETRPVLAQAVPVPTKAVASHSAARRLLHPSVEWSRYPVHLINNAMFLPLFLLAVAGLLLVPFHRRFRVPEIAVAYAWVLGSWFFLTVVFRNSTVRYALPALPALALFAALPIITIPQARWRAAAGAVLSACLLFAYGNLTVRPYGAWADMRLPAQWVPFPYPTAADTGFACYKSRLTMADAYADMGAPLTDNYKDRIFKVLVDLEKSRQNTVSGDVASYLKVGMRGMEFDQRHYWRPPNPYARTDWPRSEFPARRLMCIGMGATPRDVEFNLPQAEYVVYDVFEDQAAQETQWQAELSKAGFELAARIPWPAFGLVPAQTFGIMARPAKPGVAIDSREAIDALDLYNLYRATKSPAFGTLSAELQTYARDRLDQQVKAVAKPIKMLDGIEFMSGNLERTRQEAFVIRLIFRAIRELPADYRVYFRGTVAPELAARLPKEFRASRCQKWDFQPNPPINTWRAGEYVILEQHFAAQNMPYDFEFGFLNADGAPTGTPAAMGTIDLSKVAAK